MLSPIVKKKGAGSRVRANKKCEKFCGCHLSFFGCVSLPTVAASSRSHRVCCSHPPVLPYPPLRQPILYATVPLNHIEVKFHGLDCPGSRSPSWFLSDRDVQQPGATARPRGLRLVRHRRAIETAPRPDSQPGRNSQRLCRAREGHLREYCQVPLDGHAGHWPCR